MEQIRRGVTRKAVVIMAAGVMMIASGAAKADILIGLQGPLTGSNAAFGEQMRKGFEQAVKDINAAGGVMGQQLSANVQDDACDPKQAVAAANKLASANVVFVDGGFCSGSSIPASAIYHDAGILQISTASTNPILTDDPFKKGWNNVYRVCGRDDQQGDVAGKYLATAFKGQPIAILDDKSTYGKGLADETRKTLNKAGIKEAMDEQITAGDKDFSSLISKMKSKKIAAIYFGGYVTEAGLIARQSSEQGLKAPLMSGDSMPTQDFWQITGASGNGTLFTFNPDPMVNPAAKKIIDEFSAAGFKPEGYTLYSYATVQIFAQAASAAKSTKIKDVAAKMHGMTFHTVLGDLKFDKKGDPMGSGYVVWKWQDGSYAMLPKKA